MVFFKTSQKDNFMDYCPVVSYEHWQVLKTDGEDLVLIHVFHDRLIHLFVRLFFYRPEKTVVKFDSLSSKLWLMIDGQTNVADLCRNLGACFEQSDEADIQRRVLLFLRQLYKNRWIKLKKRKLA